MCEGTALVNCPLCELKIITKLYYKSDTVTVLNCATCHVPLAVLRRHSMDPSPEEETEMLQALNEIAIDFFDEADYFINKLQQLRRGHLCYHCLKEIRKCRTLVGCCQRMPRSFG